MRVSTFALLAAATASSASAQSGLLGFNSGATKDDNSVKKQADFEAEFSAQQKLKNAPGTFNSVRLYTNIQGGSTDNSPIEAFPAAIKTKTKLLLGMWTSGTTSIDNELNALKKAISTYGKDFTDLVVGISVGSEDLYRNSADGVKNKAGVGQDLNTLVSFIKSTRDAVKDTALAKTPIGHVDTWTAFVNGSNKAIIDAVDFLGVDLYPYYEDGSNINKSNDIANAAALFSEAYKRTEAAASGKPLWVTETGWPVSGPNWNQAVPSTDNAQKYWAAVGCALFGKVNTFWYTLRDSNPANTMKFGLNPKLDGSPLYDLSCPAVKPTLDTTSNSSSSAAPSGSTLSSVATPTASGSAARGSGLAVATGSPTGTGTGTGNGTGTGSGAGSGAGSGTGTGSTSSTGTAAPLQGGSSVLSTSMASAAGLAAVAAFMAFAM